MSAEHYREVHEALQAIDAAFIEEGYATIEYGWLIGKVRKIVEAAHRAGVEHGLAVGTRQADANAENAFSRGFIEGEKHALKMTDAVLGLLPRTPWDGKPVVCENHLDLEGTAEDERLGD